jgi:hypothetical protein
MLARVTTLTLLAASTACAHAAPPARLRAPNPNGCYAVVYERPMFEGAGDVLNGPERLPTLEQLVQTNQETWRRRIRSLRVGPAAIVTAYTEAAFKGESRQFRAESEHRQLEQALSARIESLDIMCAEEPSSR